MKISKNKVTTIKNKDIFLTQIINDNDFSFSFYNYGGIIDKIKIPYFNNKEKKEDVLLGYDDFNQYFNDDSYFNCIAGRVCNRISNSEFLINNKKYKLYSNNNGNHLHGGKEGFNKKIWVIKDIIERSNEITCRLNYLSPHMEEGYPGNLNCDVDYTFNNDNEIFIKFQSKSDQDTIINLTNHNYWNFHGHGNFYKNNTNHKIQIESQEILEIDKNGIPTGNILNIKNTDYDFSNTKTLNEDHLLNGGFDDCYTVTDDNEVKYLSTIFSEKTKMGVEIFSDQPSFQLYTGGKMKDTYFGKNNKKYGKDFGICIEPQRYIDAINQKKFKDPILFKDESYFSTIVMKLRNNF